MLARCFLIAGVGVLGACKAPESAGATSAATTAQESHAAASDAVPAALLAELRDLRQRLDTYEREEAGSAKLEADVPKWLFNMEGAERKPIEASRRRGLAAIVGNRAVEPPIRALAARALAAGGDLDDLSAIEVAVGAEGDAGTFPRVFPTQAMRHSYDVHWTRVTLGRAALDALTLLTGVSFESPGAFRTWRAENPDPESSLAYWEGTLELDTEDTRRVRLGGLLAKRPDLFLRVILAEEYRWHFSWWDSADVVRVLRERLGAAGLLRLLGREERWPEFDDPRRFDSFAAWVLEHEEALFASGDAAALLSVWEKQGASYPTGDTASKLALVAARRNPSERGRIAETTLGYLVQFQGRVLADLVQHELDARFVLIEKWFRREGAGDDIDDLQRDILRAIAAVGAPARSRLKQLAAAPNLAVDSYEVVNALVDAAIAAGAREPFPERAHTQSPGRKGKAPTAAEVARAASARRDCVARVRRWLASVK